MQMVSAFRVTACLFLLLAFLSRRVSFPNGPPLANEALCMQGGRKTRHASIAKMAAGTRLCFPIARSRCASWYFFAECLFICVLHVPVSPRPGLSELCPHSEQSGSRIFPHFAALSAAVTPVVSPSFFPLSSSFANSIQKTRKCATWWKRPPGAACGCQPELKRWMDPAAECIICVVCQSWP